MNRFSVIVTDNITTLHMLNMIQTRKAQSIWSAINVNTGYIVYQSTVEKSVKQAAKVVGTWWVYYCQAI